MDVIIRNEAIPDLQSRCANPPCNLGIASSFLLAMTIFLFILKQPLSNINYKRID
jgi:hypothetical protein